MREFELIEQFFSNQENHRADVVLGIGDDCAILEVPENHQLVTTIDTLNAGVHFPEKTHPKHIGHKALAVSLSDIASMGAEPRWVMLSLSMPAADVAWLKDFTAGLFALSRAYSLQLVGGDTCKGPLSISTQVLGSVLKGAALRRDGARPGDLIYVTGHLGDAGLALKALAGEIELPQTALQSICQRLYCPQPRVLAGQALRNIATSAIDISDGLLSDLGHILERSEVGARINVDDLPMSQVLCQHMARDEAIRLALAAGDDYELCVTVAESNKPLLQQALDKLHCSYQCIGKIESQLGLRVQRNDGESFIMATKGYQHF